MRGTSSTPPSPSRSRPPARRVPASGMRRCPKVEGAGLPYQAPLVS
eukprot:CAMPEP_0174869070 /NCGR_PEP_ID=MMETSP1114-20130205/67203_1 /TAXON_ID=312471 /ORGANISM="Neobodo designis, Strain CCAP 1951/1" /LENGTH=45 /DNA_ID= /DNA_START= /DNA_END= /DNA_ORIENTATION=